MNIAYDRTKWNTLPTGIYIPQLPMFQFLIHSNCYFHSLKQAPADNQSFNRVCLCLLVQKMLLYFFKTFAFSKSIERLERATSFSLFMKSRAIRHHGVKDAGHDKTLGWEQVTHKEIMFLLLCWTLRNTSLVFSVLCGYMRMRVTYWLDIRGKENIFPD